MKRILLGGLLVFLIAAAAAVFFWQSRQIPVPGTRLAPSDAAIFFEIPDIEASRKRWDGSALAQLLREPSVEGFLARPLNRVLRDYRSTRQALERLRPNSLFFCDTGTNEKSWMLGLQCFSDLKEWRRNVEAAIENTYGCRLRELPVAEKGVGPAVSSPTVYADRIGNWLLFSRDPAMLRAAVRRFYQTWAGLEESSLFQQCSARLPAKKDFLTFFRGAALSPDLLPWKIPSDIENMRAVMGATTIEGARLRDTVFTLEKNPVIRSPLKSNTYSEAGPDALFLGAFQLDLLHLRDLAAGLSDRFAIAESAKGYFGEIKAAGVDLSELSSLVPEVEFVLDRDRNKDNLSLLFTAVVRDPSKFASIMERLLAAEFPGQYSRREIGGISAYVLRVNESTSFVFGLFAERLYVARNEQDLTEALRRARGQTTLLSSNQGFQAIRKLVSPATDVFIYVNSKDLFDRVYPIVRPMLMFSSALVPHLNEYVDENALPEPAEVSRHLSPIIFSRHRVSNGVLDESVGPITGYQASIVALSVSYALGLFNPGS